MTDKQDSPTGHSFRTRPHPSETEIAQLLREAVQQYEECMRIADLADISLESENYYPRYAWDNPTKLEVTGPSNAKLNFSTN